MLKLFMVFVVVAVMVPSTDKAATPASELVTVKVSAPAFFRSMEKDPEPNMVWVPSERALVMFDPEASKAVVIPPAAAWTEMPIPTASVVSLFLTKTSWAAGVGFDPSANVNSVSPVEPAALVTVNLSAEFKVKAMGLPEVDMVLPAA